MSNIDKKKNKGTAAAAAPAAAVATPAAAANNNNNNNHNNNNNNTAAAEAATSAAPAVEEEPYIFSICGRRFLATRLIGEGAFGKVYEGVDTLPGAGRRRVAIKLERARAAHPQLDREYKIYSYLNRHRLAPPPPLGYRAATGAVSAVKDRTGALAARRWDGGDAYAGSEAVAAAAGGGAASSSSTGGGGGGGHRSSSSGGSGGGGNSSYYQCAHSYFRPVPAVYHYGAGEKPERGNATGGGSGGFASLGPGAYNVLVMDLLGKSLDMLFEEQEIESHPRQSRLSLRTVLLVAAQCLHLLEYVHSRSFIHRDIKPDNFVLGCDSTAGATDGIHAERLFIIDFGLAKEYRDPRTHQHIPYKEGKSLTGTARYCSINTHLGIEQSRRDDLEAIGYVWIFLLKGRLPWQGLPADNLNQRYHIIGETKMATPVAELCAGLPPELAAYIHYTRGLDFEERPDYGYCRRLLRRAYERECYGAGGCVYDWRARGLHAAVVRRAREQHQQQLQQQQEL